MFGSRKGICETWQHDIWSVFFLLSQFIKQAGLNSLTGRFWSAGLMYDPTGLCWIVILKIGLIRFLDPIFEAPRGRESLRITVKTQLCISLAKFHLHCSEVQCSLTFPAFRGEAACVKKRAAPSSTCFKQPAKRRVRFQLLICSTSIADFHPLHYYKASKEQREWGRSGVSLPPRRTLSNTVVVFDFIRFPHQHFQFWWIKSEKTQFASPLSPVSAI